MNKDIEQYGRTSIDPRTFVILDDCLYDQGWTRDKMMRLLFMNGRHLEGNVNYYYAISFRNTAKSENKY